MKYFEDLIEDEWMYTPCVWVLPSKVSETNTNKSLFSSWFYKGKDLDSYLSDCYTKKIKIKKEVIIKWLTEKDF